MNAKTLSTLDITFFLDLGDCSWVDEALDHVTLRFLSMKHANQYVRHSTMPNVPNVIPTIDAVPSEEYILLNDNNDMVPMNNNIHARDMALTSM